MIHPTPGRRFRINGQRLRDTSARAWAPCLLTGVATLVFSSTSIVLRLCVGGGLITLGLALCLATFTDWDSDDSNRHDPHV